MMIIKRIVPEILAALCLYGGNTTHAIHIAVASNVNGRASSNGNEWKGIVRAYISYAAALETIKIINMNALKSRTLRAMSSCQTQTSS